MFYKIKKYILSIFILSIFTTQSYALICSNYGDFKEYGGHYYTVTVKRLSFSDAKTFAQNSGGYLAIPDTQAENDFITSLVKGGQYAWIGVYDPNFTSNYCYGANCSYDDSRFKTIKNGALIYKNWVAGEPNNLVKTYDVVDGAEKVSPLGEHWVALASPNGKWADFGNHFDEYNNPVQYYAVYEFDTMPECFTSSNVTDQIEGLKCNTKLYDNKLDLVTIGETFDCQEDAYGTNFCPSQLSDCGSEWDYDSGYSIQNLADTCPPNTSYVNGKCVDQTKTVCNNGGTHDYNTDLCTKENKSITYHSDFLEYFASRSYQFNFCTDHFTKMRLVPDGNQLHIIMEAQNPSSSTDGRCGYRDYSSSWLYSHGLNGGVSGAFKKVDVITFPFPITDVTSFRYTFSSSGRGCNNTSGSGIGNSTNSASADETPTYGYGFDNASMTYCPGSSAQNPLVKINFLEIDGKTQDGEEVIDYISYTPECPSGYKRIDGEDTCYVDPVAYSYYEYKCKNEQNEFNQNWEIIDSGGNCDPSTTNDLIDTNGDGIGDSCNSSTPPTDNCKRKKFTCQESSDRKCAWVDNKWQCSPFPCFTGNDITTTDTEVGLTDADNNGWDSNGDCSGKIYIFNGQDNRCRSDDIFFGLTGGGCCDKDKVFLGIVPCKEDEMKLAKLNQQDRCHYVGEYCSKKIKFIGCVQHKKSFCCFNSKLARIINEQGRPQIGKDWGSAKSPQCKGFTPEEFQKLDFSKIDMSEFFGEIQQNFNVNFMQNQQNFIQDRITNNMNNINGN